MKGKIHGKIFFFFFCFPFQLDTLKYTVDRTAKDLDSTRQKYNLLKKEVANRTEK